MLPFVKPLGAAWTICLVCLAQRGMVDCFGGTSSGFTGQILMWPQSTIRTNRGVFPEDNFFHTRYFELGHQWEVPAQCLAKRVYKRDVFTLLVPGMNREHPAHFDEVRESCAGRTMRILLAVDVRNHLVKIVEAERRPVHISRAPRYRIPIVYFDLGLGYVIESKSGDVNAGAATVWLEKALLSSLSRSSRSWSDLRCLLPWLGKSPVAALSMSFGWLVAK